jgi:type I pantothenate kinase
VDLVTTDGFLYPNRVLEERGLMMRKGFPESYDQRALLRFMAAVKAGEPEVRAPVYSHVSYDIVPDQSLVVRQPDIVIVEGLNVLQTGDGHPDRSRMFVSDYFDFGIYVDAEEADIEQWFQDRFLALRDTIFRDPGSYFHKFAALTRDEAIAMAQRVWPDPREGGRPPGAPGPAPEAVTRHPSGRAGKAGRMPFSRFRIPEPRHSAPTISEPPVPSP